MGQPTAEGRAIMASKGKGGKAALHGRFSPGTIVTLRKVEGAHVQRPGPQHEVVGSETVDDEGRVEFSGLEADERYFASGLIDGQPVDVRLRGRADGDDDAVNAGYDPAALRDRQKMSDGSWIDEPRERPDYDDLPEGVTWLAQDQVKEGTLQRTDTPRGAAYPVSAQEREWATRQWRKQEPTDPVLEVAQEPTEDAGEHPACTGEVPDLEPAKGDKGRSAKSK